MNNIQELRKIIADAPEGATHVSPHEHNPYYIKENSWSYDVFIGGEWIKEQVLSGYDSIRSLDDIRTIVEQADRIADMQNQLDANARLLEFYANEYQAKGGDE